MAGVLDGNTPTGVGKTSTSPLPHETPQKHPHGRGDDSSRRRDCRCGGTIDEITFACNALGEKDSVLVSPDDYRRLLKGGGTIDDWR